MTFNFGNFNNFYPYMSNSWGFGNNYSNTNSYFKNKYGCEDCFKKNPYPAEYPKPIIPSNSNNMRPSFMKQFINRLLG